MKCLTCHGLITNGNCGCSTGTQGAASVNIDIMLRDRDAEIAALKAEVERLTARITDHEDDRTAVLSERCATDEHHCACVPVLRADLAAHKRALAAGPAAVRRQENVDVNTREAYARVVEVAQAAAMKEKP